MDEQQKRELIKKMESNSLLNQARIVFVSECERIDQANSQRIPMNIFEMRLMEFKAVEKIKRIFESARR